MFDQSIEVILFVNREVAEPYQKQLWLQSRDLDFFGYCCPDAVYAVSVFKKMYWLYARAV